MSTRHTLATTPKHPRAAAAVDVTIAVVAVIATPIVEWFDDHIAVPFAKWRADRTGWEQTAAAVRVSIALGCLIGVLFALAGCRSEQEIPGHGVEPSDVRIAADFDMCTNEMARLLQVSPEGLAAALNRTS
ncbi:MAG: hypothetical protein HOV67_34685 [Kribbellaceae bacterium]|nr:hypothetical protein [Kribbellaceae bacterium]